MCQKNVEQFVVDYWKNIRVSNDCRFERMSYRKQAAREILKYIRTHPNLYATMAIQEFSDKMNEYAERGGKGHYLFSVYHDTAEDILYQIRKNHHKYCLY